MMAIERRKLIVTGGAGFIGSAYIRKVCSETKWHIVNVDKLTYAASIEALSGLEDTGRYRLARLDICNGRAFRELLEGERPDAIIHFAAESHVDRSIDAPAAFVSTNVVGTLALLQGAREYYERADTDLKSRFRFHHISTDEVFGSLGETGAFTEDSNYRPSSPYSASKAAADHLVRAWSHTYGLPVLVSNCSNNYGPYQFPEKLIPLMIVRAVSGQTLPIYGDGSNVRDWLYVDDHVEALLAILERGRIGESYNIGGNAESSNTALVKMLCRILDRLAPASEPYENRITFVADRPGHDLRYAMDTTKIRREIGWRARETLSSGLSKTAEWYLANRDWWQPILRRKYKAERLGMKSVSREQSRF
jgi:dTDP-glucose 4,6-dehydratase